MYARKAVFSRGKQSKTWNHGGIMAGNNALQSRRNHAGNLFTLSKNHRNNRLSSDGHCGLVSTAPALVFSIVTTLSVTVKKKMRHNESFFTLPRLPPFQTIALNAPTTPGDALMRTMFIRPCQTIVSIKHSFHAVTSQDNN